MIATAWRERLRSPWWWLAGLAVLFPLARLWPLNGHFMTDWFNHQWMIGYTGDYIRHHGWPPTEINTEAQAGMPAPLFYGTLFYPLLGALATILSPGIVMRLVIIAVTWLQLRTTTAALVRHGLRPQLALGASCLTIWTIYPLTNLYNRSAITEYVAVALLGSAVALWFSLVREPDAGERRRLGLACGLCFALIAGTHPITALYSFPILLVLLALAYAERGSDRAFWTQTVRALALPVALAVIVTLPWIYALMKFQAHLQINEINRVWCHGGVCFYHGIDRWRTRFSPFPLDPRTSGVPLANVSSPYLDAQLDLPLLLVLAGWIVLVTWRRRDTALASLRAIALPLAALAFFLWISLYESAFELLPHLATMIQLSYRAVTYQNLALLLGVFAFVGVVRRRDADALHGGRPIAAAILIGCLALSAVAVVIKWQHASAIMTTPSKHPPRIQMPAEFYGFDNYATPDLYTKVDTPTTIERVPVTGGARFGEPVPLELDLPADTWVKTNVQAFPWNHVLLDHVEVPWDQLRVEEVNLAIHVPAGHHTIEFASDPDRIWLALRFIAFAVLAGWIGTLGYLTLKARGKSRPE